MAVLRFGSEKHHARGGEAFTFAWISRGQRHGGETPNILLILQRLASLNPINSISLYINRSLPLRCLPVGEIHFKKRDCGGRTDCCMEIVSPRSPSERIVIIKKNYLHVFRYSLPSECPSISRTNRCYFLCTSRRITACPANGTPAITRTSHISGNAAWIDARLTSFS